MHAWTMDGFSVPFASKRLCAAEITEGMTVDGWTVYRSYLIPIRGIIRVTFHRETPHGRLSLERDYRPGETVAL